MPDNTQKSIISAVASALSGEKKGEICGDLSSLPKFCKAHGIANIVYTGLILHGISKKEPFMKELFGMAGVEIFHQSALFTELDKLKSRFFEQGIDFMPLKGYLLREFYPSPEMRLLTDCDILIKPSQYYEINRIMEEEGFSFLTGSDHEYIWKKGRSVVIEFHKRLMPSYNRNYYRYFGEGFGRAKVFNKTEYALSAENFYIYVFTHFSKHYRDGGIGIKQLCDLYLYRKAKPGMDFEYIEKELSKLSLSEFHKNVLDVIYVWFEGKTPTDITNLITKVIMGSGAFGSADARRQANALRIKNQSGGKSAKLSVLKNKMFLPLSAMKTNYRYLEKAPYLLPVAYCERAAKAVFGKRLKIHTKDVISVNRKSVSDYENALRLVGLKFEFKEKKK